MVSKARTWRTMRSGSWPRKRCSNASKPSIVSPDPIPTRPWSVTTRTTVAENDRRGTGSHAATNGGDSGVRSRSSSIRSISTTSDPRSTRSPAGPEIRVGGLVGGGNDRVHAGLGGHRVANGADRGLAVVREHELLVVGGRVHPDGRHDQQIVDVLVRDGALPNGGRHAGGDTGLRRAPRQRSVGLALDRRLVHEQR